MVEMGAPGPRGYKGVIPHSTRNALTGSTREARIAGSNTATNATAVNTTGTAIKAVGLSEHR